MRWDKGCLTIHPLTGPHLVRQQLLSAKNERARKHLGMFLLGTLGAVHEQGPFQNVTFTLGIDSGLFEIIFQIKAVFLKPKNHTWSVKVWILKIQRNQI